MSPIRALREDSEQQKKKKNLYSPHDKYPLPQFLILI